jgi:hypothetical protein
MADFYSDHYSSLGTLTDAPATRETGHLPGPAGRGFAEKIFARFIMPTSANDIIADDDVIRMFSLRHTDRLCALWISTADAIASTATTMDVGVYLSGANHDGALDDINLFVSALEANAATVERSEAFSEAGTLEGIMRGKQMWEIVNIGGGATYTQTSNLDFDICITFLDNNAVTAGGEIVLEADVIRS